MTTRTGARSLVATSSVVVLLLAGVGCGSTAPAEPVATAFTCVDFADYQTSAEMAADAEVVVVVDRVERDGTAAVYGTEAHAYQVRVDVVEKGPVTAGETIRVASTVDGCTGGDLYADGDPLAAAPPLRLYLLDHEGVLATLTHFDGVEPA